MRYFAFLLSPVLLCALSYEVKFVGMENDKFCLKALQNSSDLIALQDRPTPSINSLHFRCQAEMENLKPVLTALAYYDATMSYEIDSSVDPVQVRVIIRPGTAYRLANYSIYSPPCKEKAEIGGCHLTADDLGLELGKQPAWSATIVNAELQALTQLSKCGYPLAYVDKRRVEVDRETKTVDADVCIEEGPLSKFGPSVFFGLKDIQAKYIARRIGWEEGEIYDSNKLVATQNKILKTDLFSSVYISHGEKLDERGELPMQFRFTESKHKQFTVGAYYATIEGPGGTFSWTNRNFRGMGEVIALEGDVSRKFWAGQVVYKKPDFFVYDQTYKALGAVIREKVFPFTAFTYKAANYVERKVDLATYSIGLKLDHVDVHNSATNGTYFLLGLPLFAKYNGADDIFNPTKGFTVYYSATPYQSVKEGDQRFVKQRLTGTAYIPLSPKRMFVLALRAQMGSIAGARRSSVPLPKLFLGGTEDDLRGYRYMSVSPLQKGTNRPLGGRGAIFTSAELRIRYKDFGFVPFADFGTVTSTQYPEFDAKWFKSVGLGVRYFAFFGPLRVDVGFPLDRRSIDNFFQVYASVGQAF